MGKITLRDVAEKAGVAKSTASYAINDNYVPGINIPQEKRDLIKKIAVAMGYQVDDMARAISTGKAKVIGFACLNPADSDYFAPMIAHLMEVAAGYGFLIKLLFIEEGENERFISTCVSQRLSGVIFYAIPEKLLLSLVESLKGRDIAPAIIGNSFTPAECIHVVNDDVAGATMIVRELYELGHRRIAYVGNLFLASEIRESGYATALKELGVTVDPALIFNSGDVFQIKDFIANLAETGKPDAVFCSGDNMAAVVISAIQECGLLVPEDISVAGFGNLACGRFHLPPISTVDESHRAVCVMAMDKIIATLSKKDHGKFYETILPSLIMRQSTQRRA